MENNISFKKEYLNDINQLIYQSDNLVKGKIIKITKQNIYFDVGLKHPIVVKKKKFVKNFFKIKKIISFSEQKKLTVEQFLKTIKVGSVFKFIIFEMLVRKNNIILIDFEKTLEYIKTNRLFYELDSLKKSKKEVQGYILNTVNGGFSVSLGGLVAFIPNNEFMINQFSNLKAFLKVNKFFINSSMTFKIININYNRKNIVLTRVKH